MEYNLKSCSDHKIKAGFELKKPIFAVAPMLDWTDRHCRFLFRQFSQNALLYTEMVVADAAIHGNREQLLGFSECEHPIALQLGGSDPEKLAKAAQIGLDFGYDEINLNVGCPSNRVQSGFFGACLMLKPEKVARAIEAIKRVVNVPVTVKCRIGVDDSDLEESLNKFANPVLQAGADGFWVHARKVWLNGLSPKENRDIPPLNYDRVYRFKKDYNSSFVGINGGIKNITEAKHNLNYVDGVMLGRAVYHNPMLLAEVDSKIYGCKQKPIDYSAIIDAMAEYSDKHIANGGRLSHVTRHMIGLFHGMRGSRLWRQILSTKATSHDANSSIIYEAFSNIDTSGEKA